MPLQRRVQHRLLPLTWHVWLKNAACTCWWLWLLETSGPITVHDSFFHRLRLLLFVDMQDPTVILQFEYSRVRHFAFPVLLGTFFLCLCYKVKIPSLIGGHSLDWVDLPITLPEPLVLMLTQVLEGPRHACLVPRKHEGVIMCLLFAVKSPFTM